MLLKTTQALATDQIPSLDDLNYPDQIVQRGDSVGQYGILVSPHRYRMFIISMESLKEVNRDINLYLDPPLPALSSGGLTRIDSFLIGFFSASLLCFFLIKH